MDRIGPIFDAYFENDLTAAEREALCAGLRESGALVDDFVRESYLHAQLLSIVRRKALHADVMASELPHEDDVAQAPYTRQVDDSRPDRGATRRVNHRLVLALAGCLFIAVTVIAWTYSRPQTVAQLTQTASNASWDGNGQWAPGTLLNEGQELRIRGGRIQVTMVSGARLVLEGPASLRFEGKNKVRLQSGRLGADVPPEATGFTVATALGEFVDLGTAFTLELDRQPSCKLFVFSGLVEVRPAGDAADNPPFQVPQTRAVSYDASTGEAELVEFSDEHRLSL
jgi:hypothetical protein